MAMEVLMSGSKSGSIRQLGIIALFIIMTIGIWLKGISAAMDFIAVIATISIGCIGTVLLVGIIGKWNDLPLLNKKETSSKMIVFSMLFIMALAITDYQIACYTIAMVVIGFRVFSAAMILKNP